jgi:Icc protein
LTSNIPQSRTSASLRIIQISDCHVSADPNDLYRGQSAERNLQKIIQKVRQWDPDLLLLTGDVSEDGSVESYERTSAVLAMAEVPLLALPGNHDDTGVMSRFFHQGPWDGPFVVDTGNWRLVLLDSTEAELISGRFSDHYLEEIGACLHGGTPMHTLVALHHQPVPVGAPWIDRYMLENPAHFFGVIDRSRRIRCITWGHVHHNFQLMRKGAAMLGTPSTVANSIPGTQRFTLDPAGPACRWLELSAAGEVDTGLLFPD